MIQSPHCESFGGEEKLMGSFSPHKESCEFIQKVALWTKLRDSTAGGVVSAEFSVLASQFPRFRRKVGTGGFAPSSLFATSLQIWSGQTPLRSVRRIPSGSLSILSVAFCIPPETR